MLIWSILNVQIYLTIQILHREVHVKITTAIKLSLSITPPSPDFWKGSCCSVFRFLWFVMCTDCLFLPWRCEFIFDFEYLSPLFYNPIHWSTNKRLSKKISSFLFQYIFFVELRIMKDLSWSLHSPFFYPVDKIWSSDHIKGQLLSYTH